MGIKILGTGSYVPDFCVSNDDMTKIVDTNDEWITTRTGIKNRHISDGQPTWWMGVQAAKKAIEDAGISPNQIGLIVDTSVTHDFYTPSTACIIQDKIGAVNATAFDINAACAGFVFALDCANRYMATDENMEYALVISNEMLSRITDYDDRSTCVLFGDGGAAAVLGEGDDLLAIHLTAAGNDEVLRIPHGENSSPFYEHKPEPALLQMMGNDVYKFAVTAMPEGIRTVVEEAGLQQSDVNWVIPHQANIRIINTAAAKLDIPRERFFCNINHYGNTSSGSVPIALHEASQAGLLKKGDIIALCAFGGGLTTGSCIIRWCK